MKDIIHILSGGLDSTILLYWLLARGYNIKGVITYKYGQRHVKEISKAQDTMLFIQEQLKIFIPHYVLDLTEIGKLLDKSSLTGSIDVPEGHYEEESMKLTVVPNRNMAFLSVAAMKAVNDNCDLSLGIHAGDHTIYPDCRESFVTAFVEAVRVGNWDAENFQLFTPFLNNSKKDIVRFGVQAAEQLHISPNDIFSRTWTCYKGDEKACGKCGACTERLEAFNFNNIEDPIPYE